MKLNLGCDIFKIQDFINIDICKDVNPDVIADVSKLPYENDSIDEIYAGHILEHSPNHALPLAEWRRVLKPGGKITITVPDTEKGIIQYRQGIIPLATLNSITFGSNVRNEQLHLSVWTEDILFTEVTKVFGNCKVIPHSPYVAYVVGWQTICEAVK